VLKGTVRDVEDGGSTAVRLQIEQIGVALEKGDKTKKWYTTWTEVERTLDVRPFYIETASGERVRVEPDEETKLIDDLELAGTDGQSRFKAAELVTGEVVYAVGELVEARDRAAGGGYRDAAKALVLRKPSDGHLLLSTHRLGVEHAQSGKLWKFSALVVGVATLIAQALAFNYHAAYFFGHTEAAKVIDRKHVPAASSDDSDYCEISFEVLSTGRAHTQAVEEEDFPKLTKGRIFPVNVVKVFGDRRVTVGAGATIHGAVHFFPAILLVLIMGFLGWLIASSTPWFLRERIVDEEEGKQV
jgi:hypothetical protein